VTTRRVLTAAVLLLVACLLQVCAVQPIPFPVGRPDLPVLFVVAVALVWGCSWGTGVGFATGLIVDLMPPADHAVGRLAFAYAAVGYAVGLLADEDEHSVLATILIVVAACLGLAAIDMALAIVLGDGTVTGASAARLVAGITGYDVVLAPFVVPLIMRLARRVEAADAR
jgi:rod shape-determining protein MreD